MGRYFSPLSLDSDLKTDVTFAIFQTVRAIPIFKVSEKMTKRYCATASQRLRRTGEIPSGPTVLAASNPGSNCKIPFMSITSLGIRPGKWVTVVAKCVESFENTHLNYRLKYSTFSSSDTTAFPSTINTETKRLPLFPLTNLQNSLGSYLRSLLKESKNIFLFTSICI